MSSPFKLTSYSGIIELEPTLKAGGSKFSEFFEGMSVPFKIESTGDNEDPIITVGRLSKKDIELVGERAAAAHIGNHLEDALVGVAEKPSKK